MSLRSCAFQAPIALRHHPTPRTVPSVCTRPVSHLVACSSLLTPGNAGKVASIPQAASQPTPQPLPSVSPPTAATVGTELAAVIAKATATGPCAEATKEAETRNVDMEAEVERLRAVYETAKAAYKAAKRAYEGKNKPCKDDEKGPADLNAAATDTACDDPATAAGLVSGAVTAAEVARLKAVSKAAKSAYKEAKEAAKMARRRNSGPLTAPPQTTLLSALATSATGAADAPPTGQTPGVQVCGGKACMRLGAEAVATVLGRGVTATEPCMKKCGGVGPTVRVDGVVAKVDLRSAVSAAVPRPEKVKT